MGRTPAMGPRNLVCVLESLVCFSSPLSVNRLYVFAVFGYQKPFILVVLLSMIRFFVSIHG